ncbi:methyltransferase [Collybia nuda]|uniref:tRNA N(3)-methylcytidine methyltransferase n=1 Tax=Collybia nuda TaxID=64659 RepID=A0A9P5YE49_9AGAR|nr:methyltransferase [Collybia nuda]
MKTTSSVHDIDSEKPPFGSRFLTNEHEVWSQNAWDHVPPPDDQVEVIAASLLKQRLARVPDDDKPKYNDKPSRHWDNFYKTNSSNFFRNRKWLHNEFPELVAGTQSEAGPMSIAEIGCGAGNSVFPLLEANRNPNLTLRAYDYSTHAVKLVQNNPLYLSPPAGTIQASVWDVTSADGLPPNMEPESTDIVILVFVISALHPNEWRRAISNVHKMLKPGGLVMFRDYGRHDLTQLRFKSGRLLDENFYIRGDKTRVYFFELDELALLFTGSKVSPDQKLETELINDDDERECESEVQWSPPDDQPVLASEEDPSATDHPLSTPLELGLNGSPLPDSESLRPNLTSIMCIHPNLLTSPPGSLPHPLFKVEQLGVDRRLLVNRKRQLKMYRVWMQGKFQKV